MRGGVDDMMYNKPKESWRRLWLRHRYSIIVYFAIAVTVMGVWHLISDGDFSFLMTLGSIFGMFSFFLLLTKVAVNKGVGGISLKTLQAYFLVYVARLCSILFYEGYLPFDKSGDWFYQFCEITSLVAVVALIVAVVLVYPRSYAKGADSFGDVYLPPSLGVLWLVAGALGLALFLHPNLNNNFMTDTAWAFALYLEAVAVMPQLYLFQKAREKEVEFFTANFAFCIAVGRLLHFCFWLSSYHELNNKYSAAFHTRYPGHFVVLSQVVNLLLMGDFVYYYMSTARSGRPVLLPVQTI